MSKSRFQKPKMSDLVKRSVSNFIVVKDEEDGNYAHIVGIPIVFEQQADIGGLFEETIARGAVSEDVLKDVAFFYNHDLNTKPLARTRTGRLKFSIESDGVHMDSIVNLQRSDSNDLYLAINDGDIEGMSWMFRVESEEWSDLDTDYPKRRITKVGYIQEISAVNYPAYEGTSIYARNGLSLDSDKKALDKARAGAVDTAQITLELEKLKAKYLFNI